MDVIVWGLGECLEGEGAGAVRGAEPAECWSECWKGSEMSEATDTPSVFPRK